MYSILLPKGIGKGRALAVDLFNLTILLRFIQKQRQELPRGRAIK